MYSLILHYTGIIEVPALILGFWCVLWKTPARMESIKWSMVILHFWSVLVDIYYNILTEPVLILPAAAGFPCGLIQHIGVTTDVQVFLGVLFVAADAVAILGFFENRYDHLVVGDHYKEHRTLKRVVYILFNYLIAAVFFIPAHLNIPDQEAGKSYMKNDIPCLSADSLNHPNFFILTMDPLVPTGCLLISEIIYGSQVAFFAFHIVLYLIKCKTISPATYRMQKAFLQALAIQLTLPFTIMCIPAYYVIAALHFEYFNQGLTNLSMIVMGLHGFFSSIVMIIVHKPYRDSVIELYQKTICRKKTDKNILNKRPVLVKPI